MRHFALALALLFAPAAFGQTEIKYDSRFVSPASKFDSKPVTKLAPIGDAQPVLEGPAAVYETGFMPNNRAADVWKATEFKDFHYGVVKIRSGRYAGSGAIVQTEGKGHWAITNHHVIEDRGRVDMNPYVETFRGTFRGETVYHSADLDLAVIYMPNASGLVMIPIADEMPEEGSEVELCGFGGPERNLRHVAANIRRSQYFNFEINIPCVSGDSGGPIIARTKNGGAAIVGMNFGGPGVNGQVRDVQGEPWELVYPASSKSNGPILTDVMTRVTRPYVCRPVIFPRLRSAIQSVFGGCGPQGCPPSQYQPQGTQPQYCPPGNYRPQYPLYQQPTTPPTYGPKPPPAIDDKPVELNPPANQPISIDDIKKAIEDMPELKGPQGEPGPVGPTGPAGPQGPQGEPGEVTQEQLNSMTLAIMQAIKDDPTFRGKDGRDGVDGRDGKDAEPVDYDKLAEEVIKRLPPIFPQWVDEDGRIIDEVPGGIKLGQTMPLRINKEVLKKALEEVEKR